MTKNGRKILLIAGDIVTAGIVTVYGFATHDRLDSGGAHMLTTLLPVLAAWVLVGFPLKVFDLPTALSWRDLWRPVWVMVLGGPFAAFLRSLWLNRPVPPIFVIVLGGISGLALLGWRVIFWAFWAWRDKYASR